MNKLTDMSPEETPVLVVDDDPGDARIAARIARVAGFEVRETKGAIERPTPPAPGKPPRSPVEAR